MIEVHPQHELIKDINYLCLEIDNNNRVSSSVLSRVLLEMIEVMTRNEKKIRSLQSQLNNLKKESDNE